MLNTIIIQPPMVQLNTPYPSGAYLLSFFKKLYQEKQIEGCINWYDLSITLFHKIFCKQGLEHIFEKSKKNALKLAQDFEQKEDANTAFQLRRYVSQAESWCNWVDAIISIVCENKYSGRELTHEFVRSAFVPRGNRMETYLTSLNRDVSADDSRILASLALADLADYITFTYDKNFSLIRYAEHLATSKSSFEKIEENLNSPILNDFLKPIINELLTKNKQNKTLFCISIPFPGTLEAAIFIAKEIKSFDPQNFSVAFGGGYVNTELRNLQEKGIFKYCDFISYDKGYGSFLHIFDSFCNTKKDFSSVFAEKPFYNVKHFFNQKIIDGTNFESNFPNEITTLYAKKENKYVRSIVPDFSTIDFSLYPRLADDTNPMHRIWNDGAWLKAYMAYGCYWHRCAFCDTSLDYVKGFCNTDIENLFYGLEKQTQLTGVKGIHFVDEACPPVFMQKFALLNLAASSKAQKISWWGNIRFEKTFSKDLADLLAYAGLTAVSAGIEIATGNGLSSVNKGTSMEHIVCACCAFKEAGILVHSYMIFGFWNQTKQDLINSMETLRQMFKAGLLDSAFWHKFSLTIHSTVFKEWQQGLHKDLKPILPTKKTFAENEIQFEGEEKSEIYSQPLNEALEFWMHAEKLNKNVESFFPFKMPKPSIAPNFVENLIKKYESKCEKDFSTCNATSYVWIGGKAIVLPSSKFSTGQICWTYMGNLLYADVSEPKANEITNYLNSIAATKYIDSDKKLFSKNEALQILGQTLFFQLRGKGLCALI